MRTQFIYFFASVSILASVTYLPIYMQSLGISSERITIVVAAYALCTFIASSLSGRGADRYGRIIFLYIGLLLAAITFASQFFANSYVTIFLGWVMNGFAVGIYPPALIAYAYENKILMGKFTGIGSLGWSVGNFLAGIIASLISIHTVFLMSGFFYFIAFLFALTLPKTKYIASTVNMKGSSSLIPNKIILERNSPVYIALFLRHSAANGVWALWPLFLSSLGFNLFQIGIVQATNALTQFFVMFFLIDHLKDESSFVIGLFLSGITFISFLLTNNFYLFLGTQILLGFSWGMIYAGGVKYVTERNPITERSTASGFLGSTIAMAGLIGPLYAFAFLNIIGNEYIYIALIVFAIISSFLSFIVFLLLRKRIYTLPSTSQESSIRSTMT